MRPYWDKPVAMPISQVLITENVSTESGHGGYLRTITDVLITNEDGTDSHLVLEHGLDTLYVFTHVEYRCVFS